MVWIDIWVNTQLSSKWHLKRSSHFKATDITANSTGIGWLSSLNWAPYFSIVYHTSSKDSFQAYYVLLLLPCIASKETDSKVDKLKDNQQYLTYWLSLWVLCEYSIVCTSTVIINTSNNNNPNSKINILKSHVIPRLSTTYVHSRINSTASRIHEWFSGEDARWSCCSCSSSLYSTHGEPELCLYFWSCAPFA